MIMPMTKAFQTIMTMELHRIPTITTLEIMAVILLTMETMKQVPQIMETLILVHLDMSLVHHQIL